MLSKKKGGFFKTRKRVRSSNFRTKQEFKVYQMLKNEQFEKSNIKKSLESNEYIISNAITFKNNSCIPFSDKTFRNNLIIDKRSNDSNITLEYGGINYDVTNIYIKYKDSKGWQSCVHKSPYYKFAFKLRLKGTYDEKKMILYLLAKNDETHLTILGLIQNYGYSMTKENIIVDKSVKNILKRKNLINMDKRYSRTIKKTNTFFKPEKIRTRINGPFGYRIPVERNTKRKTTKKPKKLSFFTRKNKRINTKAIYNNNLNNEHNKNKNPIYL